jgi:GT2 family glycosyltransferase
MPTLTISLVTANNRKLILDCLQSIYENIGGLDLETFVVINASSDDSAAVIAQRFPQVKLIVNSEKLGFTHNHNMVMRQAQGRYLLVLNDDTVILADALQKMVAFMDATPNVGILGCRIRYGDGSLQWSCGRSISHKFEFFKAGVLQSLIPFWPVRHFRTTREVTWVTGACLLARAEAVRQVGLLDENIVIYFEDGDWCFRMLQAGWKVVFYPEAEIIHFHGQTRKQYLARDLFIIYQSKLYFFRKHYGRGAQVLVRLLTFVEVALRYAKMSLLSHCSVSVRTQAHTVGLTYRRVLRLALTPANGSD